MVIGVKLCVLPFFPFSIAFGAGTATSANAIENGIVPSTSPPMNVYVAVQSLPVFDTDALIPSRSTVGIAIGSLEVKVSVAISPPLAHSGATVSGSRPNGIARLETDYYQPKGCQ